MSASTATLSTLRQLLAARHPQPVRNDAQVLATGVPAIDDRMGGVPCGALTEIVCAAPSGGSQLLLGEFLRAVRYAGGRVALVDGHDSFDPASWPDGWLEHLVWVRCRDTAMALHAADILARDANFHLVVLDLCGASAGELRGIPTPCWYRLQRAVEPANLALVVLTPLATVPSVRLRLQLDRPHVFAALTAPRPALALALTPVVPRQHFAASA